MRAAAQPVPLFGIGVPRRHLPLPRSLRGLGDASSTFPASVEQWRPLLERYAGNIPIPFLLAWIQRESAGNPCSWTSLRESGLFQLMYPDNLNTAGVTEEQLRAACVANTQQLARALTPAEQEVQVASGIRYVRAMMAQAKSKLAAAGVPWGETDPSFWAVVKLQHAYPGPTLGWLTAAKAALGRAPRDFAEFRSTINGYTSVLENAAWVGKFGVGGGGSALAPFLLAGGAALLYYLWERT